MLGKIWVQIFNPTHPGEGGIKNEVIEKFVRELKFQNMIFRTHDDKNESKRWALCLKNWDLFTEHIARRVENKNSQMI